MRRQQKVAPRTARAFARGQKPKIEYFVPFHKKSFQNYFSFSIGEFREEHEELTHKKSC